jgi:hypothetical protein
MLGAKDLAGDKDSLRFRIRGSKAANLIVVRLAADDTYTVEFYKLRGMNCPMVKSFEGVYVDSLHRVIESFTGLATRL